MAYTPQRAPPGVTQCSHCQPFGGPSCLRPRGDSNAGAAAGPGRPAAEALKGCPDRPRRGRPGRWFGGLPVDVLEVGTHKGAVEEGVVNEAARPGAKLTSPHRMRGARRRRRPLWKTVAVGKSKPRSHPVAAAPGLARPLRPSYLRLSGDLVIATGDAFPLSPSAAQVAVLGTDGDGRHHHQQQRHRPHMATPPHCPTPHPSCAAPRAARASPHNNTTTTPHSTQRTHAHAAPHTHDTQTRTPEWHCRLLLLHFMMPCAAPPRPHPSPIGRHAAWAPPRPATRAPPPRRGGEGGAENRDGRGPCQPVCLPARLRAQGPLHVPQGCCNPPPPSPLPFHVLSSRVCLRNFSS